MATTMSLINRLPIPHHIAGLALTSTFFILVILGLAHHNFRGEIVNSSPSSEGASSLRSQSYFAVEQNNNNKEEEEEDVMAAIIAEDPPADKDNKADSSYYVFLQKFPLESSFKMIFHTEVIVCPRETFSGDATFLNTLDGILSTLAPSIFDGSSDLLQEQAKATATSNKSKSTFFAAVDKEQWSKQAQPGCVQLGYGGANCGSGCCGSPHKHQNTNYALNSNEAVISNAMGDYKELFLYGISSSSGSANGNGDVSGNAVSGISGEDAYKAVCHGHMNAIEIGQDVPTCVSDWTGRDYNPLTNNCNTFTSTVLKCVYGLSDAKPHLGVSDMRNVVCPAEKREDGTDVSMCVIPVSDEEISVVVGGGDDEAVAAF